MTPSRDVQTAGDRSAIGGYPVLRTLSAHQSWLATSDGGRRVVLKTLDEDCLWKGQLHPSVKDRLARVRELAHVGVANLYGVERDGGLTYLVWDYVDGVTLEEYAASANCGRRERRAAARDLVLAVETLHARGIVHGGVKPSNVIVDRAGHLMLTHVSPLLYTDPGEDHNALLGVLDELAAGDPALAAVIAEADAGEVSLRRLATRLGAVIDARETEDSGDDDRGEGKAIRRRAMVGACVTAAMAVVLFAGLKLYANQKAPRAPVAPEAPPAAMQPAPQP